MSLTRKTIREIAIAAIRATSTRLPPERVYPNRPTDLPDTSLPAAIVFSSEDPAEERVDAPRTYLREYELAVEVFARQESQAKTVDDQVDEIMSEVRRALEYALWFLREKTEIPIDQKRSGLRGETMDTEPDGARVFGGSRLLFVFAYEEPSHEADLLCPALVPFEGADVQLSKDGQPFVSFSVPTA